MFADDTTLITTGPDQVSLEESSRVVLEQASVWFEENGLQQNHNKKETIKFATSRKTDSTATSVRLLGITLDTLLTFRNHTES